MSYTANISYGHIMVVYTTIYCMLTRLGNNKAIYIILSATSTQLTLSFLNHDLRHSIASIASISRLFLRSIIVIFAPENSRSGSAAIAGIERISKAITLRFG